MNPGRMIITGLSLAGVIAAIAVGVALLDQGAASRNQEPVRGGPSPRTPVYGEYLGIVFGSADELRQRGLQRSASEVCAGGKFVQAEEPEKYLPPEPNYLPPEATKPKTQVNGLAEGEPNPFALLCATTGAFHRTGLAFTFARGDEPPAWLDPQGGRVAAIVSDVRLAGADERGDDGRP